MFFEGPKILYRVALSLFRLSRQELLHTDNPGDFLICMRTMVQTCYDHSMIMKVLVLPSMPTWSHHSQSPMPQPWSQCLPAPSAPHVGAEALAPCSFSSDRSCKTDLLWQAGSHADG